MDIKLTPEEKDTILDKTWEEERVKGLDTSDGECIDAQISDAIAQAQLKKVVGVIERNCKGYGDRTIEQFLVSTFWREIKKIAGVE